MPHNVCHFVNEMHLFFQILNHFWRIIFDISILIWFIVVLDFYFQFIGKLGDLMIDVSVTGGGSAAASIGTQGLKQAIPRLAAAGAIEGGLS